jgi:hypothetical protein
MANIKAGAETIAKLQAEGFFVPPAGSQLDKKSFV